MNIVTPKNLHEFFAVNTRFRVNITHGFTSSYQRLANQVSSIQTRVGTLKSFPEFMRTDFRAHSVLEDDLHGFPLSTPRLSLRTSHCVSGKGQLRFRDSQGVVIDTDKSTHAMELFERDSPLTLLENVYVCVVRRDSGLKVVDRQFADSTRISHLRPLLGRELYPPVSDWLRFGFGPTHSPLTLGVSDIRLRCSKKQVVRPNARRVVALMTDVQPLRNWAVMQNPRNNMCSNRAMQAREQRCRACLPVVIGLRRASASGPDPTFTLRSMTGGRVNVRPEPIIAAAATSVRQNRSP